MRLLDQTDRALLLRLKNDARASITDLAADLGLSRVTVQNRMKTLQSDGIIRRFTVEVANVAEQESIHAMSMLQLQLSKVERVHRELLRMSEFKNVFTTNGKWAVVAQSETTDLTAFDQLLRRVGKLDGVVDVETCLLLSRLR